MMCQNFPEQFVPTVHFDWFLTNNLKLFRSKSRSAVIKTCKLSDRKFQYEHSY